jgi:uncharacterized membrane protein (UPF0182 family)
VPEEKFPWDSLFRGGDGGDKGEFPSLFRRKDGEEFGKKFKERWGGIKPRTKWIVGIILILIIVLILSASWLSTFYTDYLWYSEVGYTSVFWKRIWTQVWLFFVFTALFFVLLYVNVWLARRLTPRYERPKGDVSPVEESIGKFREGAGRWLGRGILIVTIIISFIVGWASAGQWESVLKYFTHASTGTTDPIFSKDIGFYLFEYPFLQYFAGWLLTALIFVLILTAVVHFLDGAINFSSKEQRFAPHVKAHLSVLAAIILLVQAWRFRLDMFGLLYSPRGTVIGASYTDVHAQIPAYWILIGACFICAFLFLLNVRYKGWKLPVAGLVGIIVIGLLAGALFPFIIQNYVVKPNELERESEYIGYNIEFTQDAFRIQNEGEDAVVVNREFPAADDLTYEDILANTTTIGNIRLWDPRLMKDQLIQRQELRQEYDFSDVDVDRYTVFDGTYTQMLVSARELVVEQLREDARTWQNVHISYTHGYGPCMSPTNEITVDGDPSLLIKDIPPESDVDLGVEVARPEYYYGEQTQGYVLTRTSAEEIDYPLGSTNQLVEPYYEGEGGIAVSSFLKRLAFTIRFKDINLLFSGYIKPESRLMFRRTIAERTTEVAPFLALDGDPYVVIDDEGRQKWIQDTYTTSELYPYAQFFDYDDIRFNYIRNSVKTVIDTYDGTLTYYLIDPDDPIAVTYGMIFPDLLTPFEEMPDDLKRHLRYPEDLFTIQMELYKTYHINEINSFYQKEDLWDRSTETYGAEGEPQPVQPYYIILKIPGSDREEMVLMLPFNPRGKDNMVNWVAAGCDFPDYGKLLNYSFPASKLVNGTQQFESLVDQNPGISAQISLWNQAGSRVIRGNTLVIPIEDSLIYVEPLYLLATNPPIPQIKRVIVGYGNQVEMGETLDEALAQIFGVTPEGEPEPQPEPEPEPDVVETLEQLAVQANQVYDEMINAQRNGDWATYGQKLEELNQILNRMADLTGQQ